MKTSTVIDEVIDAILYKVKVSVPRENGRNEILTEYYLLDTPSTIESAARLIGKCLGEWYGDRAYLCSIKYVKNTLHSDLFRKLKGDF